VLQKLIGAREEAGELFLCGHPEQLLDDPVLCEDISLGEPLDLALVESMHGFIAMYPRTFYTDLDISWLLAEWHEVNLCALVVPIAGALPLHARIQ
jgi:hypothetical protein